MATTHLPILFRRRVLAAAILATPFAAPAQEWTLPGQPGDEIAVLEDRVADIYVAVRGPSTSALLRVRGPAWETAESHAAAVLAANHPALPVPPPGGPSARPPVLDPFGNAWTLVPANGKSGETRVMVLPAQNPSEWRPDFTNRAETGPWRHLIADEGGWIWVAGGPVLRYLNPRKPEQGWTTFAPTNAPPFAAITALAVSPSGNVLVGFENGQVAECATDDKDRQKLVPQAGSRNSAEPVRALLADSAGRIWCAKGRLLTAEPAATNAWQRSWKLAGRLPCGNHDLAGAVCDGRFYIAGGLTAAHGYPAESHVFDRVFAYDPETETWSSPAALAMPRAYNAAAVLENRVWFLCGSVMEQDRSVATNSVEVFDPRTGRFTPGPPALVAYGNPVAGTIGGRIYLTGSGMQATNRVSVLQSIGPGETAWRREPDAPVRFSPIVSCVFQERLYIWDSETGLHAFEPATGRWHVNFAPPPVVLRSPQMAAHNGRIWLIGGRLGRSDRTDTFSWDPQTGNWQAESPAPRPVAWGAAASIGGRLYVTGGAIGRCYSPNTYVRRE